MLNEDGLSLKIKDLLVRMLDTNPVARISANEILRHPWLADERGLDLSTGGESLAVDRVKLRA